MDDLDITLERRNEIDKILKETKGKYESGKIKKHVRVYLEEYAWSEDNEHQIEEDYIKAGKLFLEIMGYCWMQEGKND